MASLDLDNRAKRLLQRLSTDYACQTPKSSLGPTIYDTAWVSMIPSPPSATASWLFPDAFDYILEQQHQDGSWRSCSNDTRQSSSDIDGIINTMASLLALIVRRESKVEVPEHLADRIVRADASLRQMLKSWDIGATDTIAFEVIVPAHLDMLEKHDLYYEFLARQHLMRLYRRRIDKINPEWLYGQEQLTLLYCLEGLIGKVDFDRLSHQKVGGSMMNSPSSTAAYLMNTTAWDVEAESYLHSVMSSGGVLHVFPTNHFEISWVVMALIEAFPKEVVMSPSMDRIADFLEDVFLAQKGLVGWAPGAIDEADDTSAAIYVLNHLGRAVTPEAMIKQYESSDTFRCFAVESNSSPSTNAHVLTALLYLPDPSRYTRQIYKASAYICDCWWRGNTTDKWNMTPHYAMMLSSQSLMGLLERWDEGLLPDIPELFLKDSVVPVLFGIAVEILQQQQTDGCWGPHSRETTAYAIITLSITASLPLCDVLKAQMDLSINNGREFLHQQIHNWAEPDSIWTGKVSYGLGTVAEAYTIAAMKISPHRYSFNKVTDRICNPVKPSLSRVKKASVLPCLAHMPNWLVDACIVESYLYLPIFNAARKELFTHHIEQQYHLDLIPLAVIACGRARSASIRPEAILAFMVSCARIYQADQYIEDIIGGTGTAGIQEAERMVHEMFEQPADVAAPMNNLNPSIEGLVDAKATLHRLTSWFLTHPQIAAASAYDQAHLRRELKDFYLNQLISVRESACMANNTRCGEKEKNPTQNSTSSHHQQQQTYHKWLHTTAASHVSGFVSLAFFTCLISPSSSSISSNEQDCFPNAEAKFYAHDLSLRLAAMARIENDIGSVRRDRDECNLNSADFPEFASAGDSESGNDDDDMERRLGQLRRLAGYERECYGKALERLRQVPGMREKVVRGLEAYCTMNDFYGELYAMEDLSPRLGRVA